MTKILVLVNPISGRGNGAKSFPLIENILKNLTGADGKPLECRLQFTQRIGQAIELAEAAASEGYDVVAAAGGDGTANEVLNGLSNASLSGNGGKPVPAMAVIPVGRGNDFAFGVGIPYDLEAACRILVQGKRQRIDVGHTVGGDYPRGRFFGNGVGIGFDTVVGFEAVKLKRLSGFPSYIVAALKTIFLYFNAPLLGIEIVDPQNGPRTLTQPCLMVSIMNGRRMGGGFMMAPEGKMDDGAFDLCIAGKISRPAVLGLIPRFMKGSQAGHPAITVLKASQVSVKALQGSLPAHADGETLCEAGERLDLSLHPGLLEIMTLSAGQPVDQGATP
jgi:diacylglycerol kinase (ATP)